MENKESKVIDLGTPENKWNKIYFRTLSKGYTLEEIEKELQDYEMMKLDKDFIIEKTGNSIDDCVKKLKALEIINEKDVNVGYLKYHFEKGKGGYREYVRVMNTPYLDYYPSSKMLTKEEFVLLKEVIDKYEKL